MHHVAALQQVNLLTCHAAVAGVATRAHAQTNIPVILSASAYVITTGCCHLTRRRLSGYSLVSLSYTVNRGHHKCIDVAGCYETTTRSPAQTTVSGFRT